MKLAMLLPAKPDIKWQLARQVGVARAVTKAAPELTGRPAPWDLDALRAAQQEFAASGFELAGLEGDQFDMSRIKLGRPGRDEDLERYRRMLKNLGELGIPLLCYNFMAGIGWYRSRVDLPERGGALTSGFRRADLPPEPAEPIITEAQLWENYAYFINAVLPAAEAAGVRMALHPDDPPVSPLQGYARIFTCAAAARRALALRPSANHGLTFCQATYLAMGEDIWKLIPEFGPKIFFLHLRDVTGTAEDFCETFHDNGPTDLARALAAYRDAGVDCLLRPDHAPTLAGEDNSNPGYGILGRLFAVGYLKGLMDAQGIAY